MKNKFIIIGIVIILLGVFIFFNFMRNDSIISKPDVNNDEVINCAKGLYEQEKNRNEFNSQCLGSCGDYAVDIVHVPRSEEDNKIENQCSDYRAGRVKHFIELDKNGDVVRRM